MEKVTEQIINVGVNDRDITLFEGQYHLEKGMAYNSYVILDEKTVVMDTVDAGVTEEWLSKLEEALGGRKADYLVVQHMEPDHAGSIQVLAERFPEMKIVGNVQTFRMMQQFFTIEGLAERQVVVGEGNTLALGAHTLQFFMAPMVHWPEVMVTYETTEKVVFSADGFGKFGTRDADEDWTCEARRYYFNICGKYGMQVQKLLQKLAGLDVAVICPLHGPVLTEDLGYYIGKYDIWSRYEPEDEGILIACASIHGNTMAAMKKLKELLEKKGAGKVVLTDLCREDLHEAVEDAFRYDTLVLAAASYDGGVFPVMEDFIRHLVSKNFQKRRIAFVENGSWAPTALRTMKGLLADGKELTMTEPEVTIRSALNAESETQMEQLAEALVCR